MKTYYAYILASKRNGALYIGVTSDIQRRVYEHKTKTNPGITSKYNISRMVLLEEFSTSIEAINREKQLKMWRRKWKIALIEKDNPGWRDLAEEMFSE